MRLSLRPRSTWLSDEDETALVERLRARDPGSFAGLYRKHHAALVRLARIFVGSRDLAEEVAQETWLAVLDGLSRFERRSSLKAWIFAILVNRARMRGILEGRTVPFSSLRSTNPDEARDLAWQ